MSISPGKGFSSIQNLLYPSFVISLSQLHSVPGLQLSPFHFPQLPYSTSMSTYILPEKAREITWPLPLSYDPPVVCISPAL